ncbi:MAG: hypothetical protein GAK28_04548 [Luteibacter sp.]|nr:MAG: hypothetical protein GAK28_04548 [Luteibacter sp.]
MVDRVLRTLVADVLGVSESRVVEYASLTCDLGMYALTEAELGFAIESAYNLRSGWWRDDSDTFGDLVHDVQRALAVTRLHQLESTWTGRETGSLPQRDLYVTPSATIAAHIVSIPKA